MRFLLLGACFLSACAVGKKSTLRPLLPEQHRPAYHFTPPKGWMNDPNGLVYYKGEYHLFYQHYPDSIVWGPMHWGHAVSKDLVHWQDLPIALYPDSLGYIFSGSIVLDEKNTAGFKKGRETPMVAVFTYHDMEKEKAGRNDRESQAIAYSLDRGRNWTKYPGNPVLPNKGDTDFRDPKVFWYEPSQRWIMPLAVGEHLEFFASPDLKNWEKTGDFGANEGAHGGVWECPDLFSIRADDGTEKWVLIQNMGRGAVNGGSGTQYFVGRFDGRTFVNDHPPATQLWLDYGADNYASVTWFGAPRQRRIFIGWMSNWDDYAQTVPATTWRSAMTLPRDLQLKKTEEGYRLYQNPVPELRSLRTQTQRIPAQIIQGQQNIHRGKPQIELELTFDQIACTADRYGFVLANAKGEKVVVGYDAVRQVVYIDRTQSGKTDFSTKFARKHEAPLPKGAKLTLHALADAASVELFVNDGKIALTDIFFPNEDYNLCSLFAENGTAVLMKGQLHQL